MHPRRSIRSNKDARGVLKVTLTNVVTKDKRESRGCLKHPFVIGVGGLTSNVGKTTLMCDLLQSFSGLGSD